MENWAIGTMSLYRFSQSLAKSVPVQALGLIEQIPQGWLGKGLYTAMQPPLVPSP